MRVNMYVMFEMNVSTKMARVKRRMDISTRERERKSLSFHPSIHPSSPSIPSISPRARYGIPRLRYALVRRERWMGRGAMGRCADKQRKGEVCVVACDVYSLVGYRNYVTRMDSSFLAMRCLHPRLDHLIANVQSRDKSGKRRQGVARKS